MDQVITISEDAKKEIGTYLKVPPNKISVIYPAPQFEADGQPSQAEIEKVKQTYKLETEYLLYIGQIGMKKKPDDLD